jgi:hypothetical protein
MSALRLPSAPPWPAIPGVPSTGRVTARCKPNLAGRGSRVLSRRGSKRVAQLPAQALVIAELTGTSAPKAALYGVRRTRSAHASFVLWSTTSSSRVGVTRRAQGRVSAAVAHTHAVGDGIAKRHAADAPPAHGRDIAASSYIRLAQRRVTARLLSDYGSIPSKSL